MSDKPHDDVALATGPETIVAAPASPHGGLLPMLIDFGPLLIFFLAYKFSPSSSPTVAAIQGTMAFMAAIILAMLISKWRLGRISPMLWMSGILVVGFGALTIYFHDQRFIQIKPTIIYALFALMLLGGWMRGKPLLKYLLQAAFDGLDETGWLKLSRNWGLFFAALALVNEALRMLVSFDTWLTVKVWGITAASFLFALSQLPVMLRHGMALPDETESPDTQG